MQVAQDLFIVFLWSIVICFTDDGVCVCVSRVSRNPFL